jgi:hypothetical protein
VAAGEAWSLGWVVVPVVAPSVGWGAVAEGCADDDGLDDDDGCAEVVADGVLDEEPSSACPVNTLPTEVPEPALPHTTEDSGLPAASSTIVTPMITSRNTEIAGIQ